MGKIRLAKEHETYLATLYGKALDARAEHPILGDRFAADAVARIDLDFRSLKLPRGGEITLPMRALHFDRWTRAFLAENPRSTVLHLGCGLDARALRIDPGPGVLWLDVDRPDVIELRRQLFPERPGYQLIGTSVTDLGWLEPVPKDRPALVVAEGLVHYMPAGDLHALFRRIVGRCPAGQIAFDAYAKIMLRGVSRMATVRGAKVTLAGAVDDPKALEREIPGLRLVEDVPFLTMPELVARLSTSWSSRLLYGLLVRVPLYRRLVRHLRYEFGPRQRDERELSASR
jgi:O-methyltransferase involved in polyketide biosynthesis